MIGLRIEMSLGAFVAPPGMTPFPGVQPPGMQPYHPTPPPGAQYPQQYPQQQGYPGKLQFTHAFGILVGPQ